MSDYLGTLDGSGFSLPIKRQTGGHLYRSLSQCLSSEQNPHNRDVHSERTGDENSWNGKEQRLKMTETLAEPRPLQSRNLVWLV